MLDAVCWMLYAVRWMLYNMLYGIVYSQKKCCNSLKDQWGWCDFVQLPLALLLQWLLSDGTTFTIIRSWSSSCIDICKWCLPSLSSMAENSSLVALVQITTVQQSFHAQWPGGWAQWPGGWAVGNPAFEILFKHGSCISPCQSFEERDRWRKEIPLILMAWPRPWNRPWDTDWTELAILKCFHILFYQNGFVTLISSDPSSPE